MLSVNKLACIREERLLFENLNFSAKPGDFIQIEGPNGIGKTSLLRILAGLSSAFEGSVSWLQESINDCRETYHQDLLFLGHQSGVKAELSAYENLTFFQSLYNTDLEIDLWQVLALVGLAGFEDQSAAHLSAGQQRRISLARLWMTKAKLWILDEPFTAIDKRGVKVLEQHFLNHCQAGGIVIITSHQDLLMSQDKLQTISLGALRPNQSSCQDVLES